MNSAVRLKGFHILKLTGSRVGVCKFAVLIATSNPLENGFEVGW